MTANRRPLVVPADGKGLQQMPAGDTIATDVLPPNVVLPGQAAMRPPVGAKADRPVTPGSGDFRYNSELGCHEGYTPDGWVAVNNLLVSCYSGNVGQSSGTTRIPYDTTPPLVTEGTQLWTKTVTPKYAGAVMFIDFSCQIDNSNTGGAVTMSLYKGSTLLCCVSAGPTGMSANKPNTLRVLYADTIGALGDVVYSCRIGNETSGTWYVNRGQTATMGGTNVSTWRIDEVLQ